MHQHIVSITFWITIDNYDNFMQFWGLNETYFIVFHDFNLIIASIFIMLFKSTCKYGTININKTFTNNNNNNGYQNDVGESIIGDNRSGIIAIGFGNSTKRLMTPNAVACKSNSAPSNNLNKTYFQLGIDELANYRPSMYSELFLTTETDVAVNWKERIVLGEQLLSDTTEKEAIFANLFTICNHVKMKEYNVLQLYSSDTVHSDQIKDDFGATMIETLFEDPNITSSNLESRIARIFTKADITFDTFDTFNTLSANASNNVIEIETQSGCTLWL